METKLKNESGMTLIESLFAMVIMVLGLVTMAQVLAFCVVAGKSYGRDAGQTTAAARDKMDELMGMRFSVDPATNVVTVATALSTGNNQSAGSIYPDAPVSGYSDRLDSYGAKAGADLAESEISYIRQWKIDNDTSGTFKTISVSVRSNKSFKYGTTPTTVMVTNKGRDTEELDQH